MFFRHLEGLLGLIAQCKAQVMSSVTFATVSVIITSYVYTLICDYRFQNIFYPYFFNEISQNFHVPVVSHHAKVVLFNSTLILDVRTFKTVLSHFHIIHNIHPFTKYTISSADLKYEESFSCVPLSFPFLQKNAYSSAGSTSPLT